MAHFHESDELRLRAAEQERLQTISMFANAVGLSASALRQYAESGLLPPTAVEERTGYRYYALDQQQRGIWIRRLRDAGLRLERIRAIFESDVAGAEAVLDDWLADAQERLVSIETLVDDLKSSLRAQLVRNPRQRTSVRFDSAVLASAIRQLTDVREWRAEATDFDGVLVEVRSDSVGIIATDRYVLLARMNVPAIIDGPPARVRLSKASVVAWLRERQHVELIVEIPTGRDERAREVRAWLRDTQDEEIALPQTPDRFPDVHQIIDAIEPASGRSLFARDDVLRFAAEPDAHSVFLEYEERSARLTANNHVVSGPAIGTFSSLELSRSALLRIARAAVGDELTCDIGELGRPLVWRAPSQPDFVALMMPRMA